MLIGNFAVAAPLCSQTIEAAGGGIPNVKAPTTISTGAAKELQLAYFLKNLEVSFFSTNLPNTTAQEISKLPNGTIEIISRIAAVST